MPAREISIVALASDLVESLTAQGRSTVRSSDLVIHDDTIDPDFLASLQVKTTSIAASAISDVNEIEGTLRVAAEALQRGERVTRLVSGEAHALNRLSHELRLLQIWNIRYRIIPNRDVFEREAWQLQLPWLLSARPTRFRMIEAAPQDERSWSELATTADTLVMEPTRESLQYFIERLLMSGADPLRPVALVSHSPTQDPMCWMTTLDELDEIIPLWKTPGATILYIGSWPQASEKTARKPDFWGPLAPAADHWVRTGTLAETF